MEQGSREADEWGDPWGPRAQVLAPRLGTSQPMPGNMLPLYLGYDCVLTSFSPLPISFFLFQRQADGSRGTRKGPALTHGQPPIHLQEWVWLRASFSSPSGWLRGASSTKDVRMGQCRERPGNSTDLEVCHKNSGGCWHLEEDFVERKKPSL